MLRQLFCMWKGRLKERWRDERMCLVHEDRSFNTWISFSQKIYFRSHIFSFRTYSYKQLIYFFCDYSLAMPKKSSPRRNMRDDEEEETWMRGANSLCSNNGRLWFSVNAGLRILLLASCPSYTLILCVMQYVDGLHVFYWWLSISHFIFVAVDFIIQSVVTILGLFSAL